MTWQTIENKHTNHVCLLYGSSTSRPWVQFFGNCCTIGSSESHCLLFQKPIFKTNSKKGMNTTHTQNQLGEAWENPFRDSNSSNHFIHPILPTLTNQKGIHQPTATRCKPHPESSSGARATPQSTKHYCLGSPTESKDHEVPEHQWESTWLALDMDGWILIPCVSPAQNWNVFWLHETHPNSFLQIQAI